MSTRYTLNDIRAAVRVLETTAKVVGVMPKEAYLSYGGGNPSNGVSATLYCYTVTESGGQEMVRVRFLPEFTHKSTRREQFKMIEAANNALHAVNMKD
jgi:hypothetical protein